MVRIEQIGLLSMKLIVPFGIFALGGVLRIYNFWQPPIWLDEYGTWWVVTGDSWLDVSERAFAIQGQSPFYYLIVRFSSQFFGYTSFAFRLPSIVFGIGTTIIGYLIARRLLKHETSVLLAFILVSISDGLILYSQMARPYALALFLALLSTLFFITLLKKENLWLRFGYVIIATLTIYAHYLFGFIIVVHASYLISERLQLRSSKSLTWIVTFIAIAILSLPLAAQLMDLFGRRHALDVMTNVSGVAKIANIITYFTGHLSPTAIMTALILRLTLHHVNEDALACDDNSQITRLLIIWLFFPILIFAATTVILGVDLFVLRYLLFAVPAVFYLLAKFLVPTSNNNFRTLTPALALVILSITLTTIPAIKSGSTFSRWPIWPWNEVANVIANQYEVGDIIVADFGFVEVSHVVNGSMNADFQSYLSWPLIANLPTSKNYTIRFLPTQLTKRNKNYFSGMHDQVLKYKRIWIVGRGEIVAQFQSSVANSPIFDLARHSVHGDIQLFRMDQLQHDHQ